MPVLPEGRSLYIQQPLTTISTAYSQAGSWIADQVFPSVPVARQGDLYWRYPAGDWFRSVAQKRAPATESAGGGWTVTTDNYYANVYAVHKDIDDQTRVNATGGGFNLDADGTKWVTEQLMLKRDQLFVAKYLASGLWTGGTGTNGGANSADLTGVASAPGANQFLQFDQAGSDPIGVINRQILGMVSRTGLRPNTLVLGPSVYVALLNNQSIIDRVKYTGGGFLRDDILAEAFGVDKLVVTWTIQNTAPRGATDALSFLNDKTMFLCYAAPAPGLQTLSAGYIFTWDGLLGAGSYGTSIAKFRMEPIQSDRIEGQMAFDLKAVATDLGVFFLSVVS